MFTFKDIQVFLVIIILVLASLAAAAGLFCPLEGQSFFASNLFGQEIKIFGQGLYAHESFFKAPINLGTDAVSLFLAIPLFLASFLLGRKNNYFKIIHLGISSYILYYAGSLAFGVAYNSLILVYISFFSFSVFYFIFLLKNIINLQIHQNVLAAFPHRALTIYLFICGTSLSVWLVEIIVSLFSGKPPETLGMNTTEPTYVIDLAIVAPSAFLSAILLINRKNAGYVLGLTLLCLSSLIGIVVLSQSLFQWSFGIKLSPGQLIAFSGIFIMMSLVSLILLVLGLKQIKLKQN